ncbi:MAG: NAD(P)/FAD-dependent oxidoreductase [Chloroflexi bacterium]|nr:NAD(P)/FAD-dependent oxidoreductase [Chloroflexota bacterium]MBI3930842.1 NAD(P)/FAD-dependent oxidoreductase [Chloroflexota bacterium]
MYDVAVIGAGPAGSRVAYQLAARGYEVVVVEQKESLGEPVCCTGIISRECVTSFDIDGDVILREVNSARVFSPSGKLLSLRRAQPQAYIVDRAAFNVALARRAQAQGVDYILNSPVRGMKVGNDNIRIELASYGGELKSLEARAGVIATGFGSKLVEGLGLGRVGDFVSGAQAEVETMAVDEVEVYLGQELAPAFFAWLVPTSPQRALVGLLSRRSPGVYLRRLMSSLLAQGKIVSTEAGLSYGGIPLKPLARTYGDRLMVVGSAAGQVKPTSGGGIYYGLLCADMAADSLHQALKRDTLSAKNLANYEREWKRKLGRELKVGYWGRRFYELLSDRQIDSIFGIIKSDGIDEALLKADDLSFDWHGQVILRLIGHQALSRIFRAKKPPFPPQEKEGLII